MKEEDLKAITKSIEDKIGKENSGVIADDLGKLYTLNKQTIETISKMEEKNKDLTSTNEKLVIANGNLLQSIPMGKEETKIEEEAEVKPFNFKSLFDDKGNFLKK